MFLPSQWMKWLKGCGRGSPQRAAIFSFLCGHFLLQAEKGGIYFASPWMNLDLPQLAAYGRSDVGPVLDLAVKRPTLGLVKASHHDRNGTTLRSPCSDTAQSSLMERPWGRAPRHQICEWRLRQQLNAAEFCDTSRCHMEQKNHPNEFARIFDPQNCEKWQILFKPLHFWKRKYIMMTYDFRPKGKRNFTTGK